MQSVHIVLPPELQDELIASLCALDYEGFEQKEDSILAYIPLLNFDENALNILLSKYNLSYSLSIINKINWNAVWENNFQPIVIANRLSVRADFHSPIQNVSQELIITPRMSFGTGHHATTSLMLEALLDLPLKDARVLDFGTGTGILGILAAKLGANYVVGIDNDTWCIENATDNCKMNGVSIDLQLSEEGAKAFPYAVEVKNQERLNIWQSLLQTSKHAEKLKLEPLLAFRRNRSEMWVAIRAEHFLELSGVYDTSLESREQPVGSKPVPTRVSPTHQSFGFDDAE